MEVEDEQQSNLPGRVQQGSHRGVLHFGTFSEGGSACSMVSTSCGSCSSSGLASGTAVPKPRMA